MFDRRSQRIRANFKLQANRRSRASSESASFNEQMRRAYVPPQGEPVTPVDHHAQLARQLATQRRTRR